MNNTFFKAESCWRTYIAATVFALPAVASWLLLKIFILPKLHKIWLNIEPATIELSHTANFLFSNIMTPLFVLAIAIVILEWAGVQWWSRYRNHAVGVIVWLFNFAVIIEMLSVIIILGMFVSK